MNELEKQVRRAQRRLGFQRFLGLLGWCWFATLLVALGLISVGKFFAMGVPAWGWAAGALGLGLAAAGVWMVATRRGALGAAVEIDSRFGLKERVSSTLSMGPDDRATEAGQALVKDAVRRVGRVDVASRFAVRPDRRILLPLLPAALALLVAVYPVGLDEAQAKSDKQAVKDQIKKSSESLKKKMAERRKKAQEKGLKDAEQLFKKLEQGSRDMTGGKTDRKKALAKLNDLSRTLQQRRNQLGSDRIKKQLDQLKNISRGPANKFAQAMRDGDFKKAAKELEAIKKQLAGGDLTDQQKKDLAGQLGQMQEKLKELAEAHQAAQRDMQKQIAQMRQAGQMAEANKLEEQLAKLMQQAPQMEKLNEMAAKLGQCAKCLQNGQLADAAAALDQLEANLQQQLDEMAMLNEAMDQLRQMRNQMGCGKCGGAGCKACEGMGMGAGRGKGDRPEADVETDTYESQVRGQIGKGTAVVTDLVEGPNLKGNVEGEIQKEIEAARQSDTDPLTNRRIPRRFQEHVGEYFNRFREGE